MFCGELGLIDLISRGTGVVSVLCGFPAHHRENFFPIPGDQTLSPCIPRVDSPQISILSWPSCRSSCSPEVLLLRACPKLWPLSSSVSFPQPFPSLSDTAARGHQPHPCPSGGFGRQGPSWECHTLLPQCPLSIPGDVVEIAVDKGLDVMSIW